MMIMALNIRTCFMFLTVLTMMSSNQLLFSSRAAITPSSFPFVFMTVDGERAAARRYDYIVVGGGTAGCPLAATLSTKYSVLVLERGGSPYGDPDIENADAFGKVLDETDNYTSPAQTFISEDGVSSARARVLGGGTAINAGFYSRASSDYVSNMGWDERLVEESYEWVEKQNAFKPHSLSPWSSAVRDGLLEAGVLPYNGYTLDHLDGTKISASTFDSNGKRHTAADLLKSANPDNIVVLLNATVSRVLFNSPAEEAKNDSSRKPRASGVEFTDGHGRSYQVFLNESSRSSEIILTAGALGSPQLLLLSGIGPSEHLKEFNIPLLLHSPLVGQRIQDNPRASIAWQSHQFYTVQVVGILKGSQNYIEPVSYVNGSASPHGPNKNNVYNEEITEKLAFPLSRGELRLRSRDPRDNPSVRYNYYSDPLDLQRCVQAVRVIAKLLDTPSLRRFNADSYHDFNFTGHALPKNMSDDAAVAQICRDTLSTMWHNHGGCEVGYVVNERYQVNGVDNLRIVDTSTFTDSPGTNPQATTSNHYDARQMLSLQMLATTLSADALVADARNIENGNVYGKLLGETNNYTSPAQTFISEDGVTLDRARVLGGATALNAGFYSRAISKFVRKLKWNKRLVKDSYEWVEKQNAFKPRNLSSWSSAFRDGRRQAGVVPYNGYTLDHVDGTKISASIFDNNGKRHTAADLLKTANPNNIVVLLNATVSRILFNSPTSQGKPRARGVELVDDNGRSYQALLTESSCSSEVILSAGSIGSPQLLLLSGIGPSEHLQEFNIPLVLHLPLVGKGIQDSPRATVTVQTPTPHEFSSIQAVGILPGSRNYIESSFFVQPKNVYAGNIFQKLGVQFSRGELRLRSTDPRDNPSVRYNYYSHPLDLKRCVDGVRVIDKILKTRSLQRFTFAAANGSSPEFHFIGRALPNNTWDDAAVVQFCRDTLDTMWHFHGGCHVGPVVNHRYQVNGVESLRIVDGSTFEHSPGTNPQATTLMLGRYVGTKILQERRSKGY